MSLPRRATVILLALAACQTGGPPSPQGPRVTVVASIAPLEAVAAEVGGDLVRVRSLVPAGTDPRTSQLDAQAGAALATADVVLLNGLGLEPWQDQAIELAPEAAIVTSLGDATFTEDELLAEAEGSNPALWPSVGGLRRYAAVVKDTFARADPAGVETYQEHAETLDAHLATLADAISTANETAPPGPVWGFTAELAYVARDLGRAFALAPRPAVLEAPTRQEIRALRDEAERLGARALFTPPDIGAGARQALRRAGVITVRDLELHSRRSPVDALATLHAAIVAALDGDPAVIREAANTGPATEPG